MPAQSNAVSGNPNLCPSCSDVAGESFATTPPQEVPAPIASEAERKHHKRILVVDDDQDVRELINQVLTIDGHSVTEAQDPIEALGIFRDKQFDLVITDFEMPKMKGDQFVGKVKELVPSQRIIMVSANGYKLGERVLRVDVCLDKPFLTGELLAAVSKVLYGVP
jgi:CheY-like chemotaxis protein